MRYAKKQLLNWVSKLETTPEQHQEIDKFLPHIEEKLQNLDRAELLRRVVSLEFEKFLEDYRNGDEVIDASPGRDRHQSSDRYTGKDEKYTRLFLNFGKSDGFYPEQLIELINSKTKGRKVPIGKIDLMKSFSFFEVEQSHADYLINTLNNSKYDGRKIILEVAQEKNSNREERNNSRGKYSGKRQGGEKKRRKEFGRSYSR